MFKEICFIVNFLLLNYLICLLWENVFYIFGNNGGFDEFFSYRLIFLISLFCKIISMEKILFKFV